MANLLGAPHPSLSLSLSLSLICSLCRPLLRRAGGREARHLETHWTGEDRQMPPLPSALPQPGVVTWKAPYGVGTLEAVCNPF
ncbi:hypothetical protein EDB81DRAFT_779521, partial [Dactylonectria macrodidyma]